MKRLILIKYAVPAKVFMDRELLVVFLDVVVAPYLEEVRLNNE